MDPESPRIVREPLDGPVARELIVALDAELTDRYPQAGGPTSASTL
jgi:hypothetical protein